MSEIATYNLGAVLRETNINPDTLRAWERRYKLPQPMRSAGGQRLYSQRDFDIIKWLMRQQENGMRIGQAVKLWRNLIAQGEDPLNAAASSLFKEEAIDSSQLDLFRKKWVAACVAFDEGRVEDVMSEAFIRFSPEVAFIDIFFPGICEIGELWYQGKVTVQQEHFASALLMRRLDALISALPAPTRPEKMVVACPPKEEHTLSAALLTLFLRRRGFQVIYLGTNVPLEEFQETVDVIQPQLVLLTAHHIASAATLEQAIRSVTPTRVVVAYSGRIFQSTPLAREYVHGHFLEMTFPEVFASIENLLQQQCTVTAIFPENPYQYVLNAFEMSSAAIQASLIETFAQWDFPLTFLINAGEELSEKIAASLYLGDLELLTPELVWVKFLLDHRNVREVRLEDFLRIYAKAVRETLGATAQPLVDWLEKQSEIYANIPL